MADDGARIESALARLAQRLFEDPRIAAELGASRGEFFQLGEPLGGDSGARAAQRRHVEWFLLERPCTALGGVPVEVVAHADSGDAASGDDLASLRSLLASPCGVFEVTSVRPGEGVWVRDLAGRGEYPLAEPESSLALESGDVLVGRLFAVGDSLYRASPAAGCFRGPKLAAAVAADLDLARGKRRGVLRLSQAELERLFWSPIAPRAGERLDAPDDPIGRARTFLGESGVESERIDRALSELARSPFDATLALPGANDALGRVLEGLAFETSVDLERARRLLLEAWPRLAIAPSERAGKGSLDVRAAIEAFDRGREAGRDLDQLFDQLERDLGLGPEAPAAAEDALAPDFPGVVGALIEEYLWESSLEGERGDRERAWLARFAEFGADVGVFENLGARHLLEFACVWLPERGQLEAPEEARGVLEALRRFCDWSERTQEVPLLAAFDAELGGIGEDVARLVPANAHGRDALEPGGELCEFVGKRGEKSLLRRGTEEPFAAAIDPRIAAHLTVGDFVRGSFSRADAAIVRCCYPPQRARLAALR